ncbi:hypothetical protein [Methylobacterium aquaticum]|nr:hypothetical protein [Methylobacterium aquaticum]
MSRLPHTISNQSLTFFVKGKPYSLTREHEHFEAAKALLQQPGGHPVQKLVDMVDVRQALLRDSFGALQVIGADLVFKGQVLKGLWVDKIKAFRAAGEPFAPLFNALGSLLQNPTPEAIERLPVFLEKSNLGFLEDGRFIAYKAVREDYFDVHTGRTHRNMVGDTPHMDRDKVNADPNACCSTGLHVGTPDYVQSFYAHTARRVMLIAVWPHDVVSVPHSYGGTKMRICAYEVIDELDEQYASTILGRPVLTPRSQLPAPVVVEAAPAPAAATFDIDEVEVGDVVSYRGDAETPGGNYTVVAIDPDGHEDLMIATATGQAWLLNDNVAGIVERAPRDDEDEPDGYTRDEQDEHYDAVNAEIDAQYLADQVEVGDVVTLTADPGAHRMQACRAAGNYSVRAAAETTLLVEDATGRSWVERTRVVAATRNGVDIMPSPTVEAPPIGERPAPALLAQVGDLVTTSEGGWPPAGVYPVIRVDEGREYRLTVQTEHDGEQGVRNCYVVSFTARPWLRAEIGGTVDLRGTGETGQAYRNGGRGIEVVGMFLHASTPQLQLRTMAGPQWIDATRVTAAYPKA